MSEYLSLLVCIISLMMYFFLVSSIGKMFSGPVLEFPPSIYLLRLQSLCVCVSQSKVGHWVFFSVAIYGSHLIQGHSDLFTEEMLMGIQ